MHESFNPTGTKLLYCRSVLRVFISYLASFSIRNRELILWNHFWFFFRHVQSAATSKSVPVFLQASHWLNACLYNAVGSEIYDTDTIYGVHLLLWPTVLLNKSIWIFSDLSFAFGTTEKPEWQKHVIAFAINEMVWIMKGTSFLHTGRNIETIVRDDKALASHLQAPLYMSSTLGFHSNIETAFSARRDSSKWITRF